MTYEEKGTWVYLVVSAAVYAVYVNVVLGRADGGPLTEVTYVAPLLWSIGAAIVAAIVLRIVVEIVLPSETPEGDERDAAATRRGTLAGNWGIVAGALGGLALALADQDTFWIANTIYLGFVLSALTSSVVTLVAYRRGV